MVSKVEQRITQFGFFSTVFENDRNLSHLVDTFAKGQNAFLVESSLYLLEMMSFQTFSKVDMYSMMRMIYSFFPAFHVDFGQRPFFSKTEALLVYMTAKQVYHACIHYKMEENLVVEHNSITDTCFIWRRESNVKYLESFVPIIQLILENLLQMLKISKKNDENIIQKYLTTNEKKEKFDQIYNDVFFQYVVKDLEFVVLIHQPFHVEENCVKTNHHTFLCNGFIAQMIFCIFYKVENVKSEQEQIQNLRNRIFFCVYRALVLLNREKLPLFIEEERVLVDNLVDQIMLQKKEIDLQIYPGENIYQKIESISQKIPKMISVLNHFIFYDYIAFVNGISPDHHFQKKEELYASLVTKRMVEESFFHFDPLTLYRRCREPVENVHKPRIFYQKVWKMFLLTESQKIKQLRQVSKMPTFLYDLDTNDWFSWINDHVVKQWGLKVYQLNEFQKILPELMFVETLFCSKKDFLYWVRCIFYHDEELNAISIDLPLKLLTKIYTTDFLKDLFKKTGIKFPQYTFDKREMERANLKTCASSEPLSRRKKPVMVLKRKSIFSKTNDLYEIDAKFLPSSEDIYKYDDDVEDGNLPFFFD